MVASIAEALKKMNEVALSQLKKDDTDTKRNTEQPVVEIVDHKLKKRRG